MTTRHLVI